MNKSAMAAALVMVLGSLCGAAAAQSSVTIYGLIDIGVVHESGGAAGPVNKVTSGMSHGSRIGFKGTEDLGDGMSALFLLESGYQLDTGASGQGGALFGRQGYVGLSGGFGTVTAGRQYTPYYNTEVMIDPFVSGLAGDTKNLMSSTGDSTSRMNNSVKYASPEVAGFKGDLVYGAGETADNTKAASQWGGSLGYLNGPLSLRVGYHYRNNDTATTETSSARNLLVGGWYDFGPLKLHFGYGVDKGVNSAPYRNTANPFGYAVAPVATTDSTDLLLGLTVPYGRNTFLASYIRKNDKMAANQDAQQFAIGHRYALSKRTDTYLSWGHIRNNNGASYTVGSSIESGTGNGAVSAGIRHQF